MPDLADQRARLRALGDVAAQSGDFNAATANERAITKIYELIGKLVGELVNRSEVRNVSLLVSPDYHRLREALTTALRAYPEASRAVAQALHRMESEALAPASPAPPLKVIEHVPPPPFRTTHNISPPEPPAPPKPPPLPPCPIPPRPKC